MKRIYLVFVLSIIVFVTSCSESDDFTKVPYRPIDSLAVWPLKMGNQWIFAKDTILDTIKIDTSFVDNGIEMYKSNLKHIFLPTFIQNNGVNSYIYNLDSIYGIKVNNHIFIDNSQTQRYSDIILPIISQKLDNEIAITGTNKFAHEHNSVIDSVTVNYSSIILGKHLLEGVGGRAFQDVLKVQSNYQFVFPTETKVFSLEIWLQPGVGPVKVVNLENNKTQILHSYQIF